MVDKRTEARTDLPGSPQRLRRPAQQLHASGEVLAADFADSFKIQPQSLGGGGQFVEFKRLKDLPGRAEQAGGGSEVRLRLHARQSEEEMPGGAQEGPHALIGRMLSETLKIKTGLLDGRKRLGGLLAEAGHDDADDLGQFAVRRRRRPGCLVPHRFLLGFPQDDRTAHGWQPAGGVVSECRLSFGRSSKRRNSRVNSTRAPTAAAESRYGETEVSSSEGVQHSAARLTLPAYLDQIRDEPPLRVVAAAALQSGSLRRELRECKPELGLCREYARKRKRTPASRRDRPGGAGRGRA